MSEFDDRADAAEWLIHRLEKGSVEMDELFRAAAAKGMNPDVLVKAMADMKVVIGLSDEVHELLGTST